MTPARDVLIVFGRLPALGRVKTRLAAGVGDRAALELYSAFLSDTLDSLSALPCMLRLYVPLGEEQPPAGLLPAGAQLRRQRGSGLGERMLAAFVESFADGFDRVVIVGSDHPTLPVAFVELAFDELRQREQMVIGPSSDGGYYLIGANGLFPDLFAGMDYSHEHVFADTMERAAGIGAGMTILPPWYDIDSEADLERLARDLTADPYGCHRTREVMANLRDAKPDWR